MAEAEDLKSSQCGFDPHSGHKYGLLKLIQNMLGRSEHLKILPTDTSLNSV